MSDQQLPWGQHSGSQVHWKRFFQAKDGVQGPRLTGPCPCRLPAPSPETVQSGEMIGLSSGSPQLSTEFLLRALCLVKCSQSHSSFLMPLQGRAYRFTEEKPGVYIHDNQQEEGCKSRFEGVHRSWPFCSTCYRCLCIAVEKTFLQ